MLRNRPAVIGLRLPRLDGVPKVTGRHVYATDIALPGMLFGKVLRSTHAHARIRGIDVSRARALPGVRGIITMADIPNVLHGFAVRDTTVFASDTVRFVGHPVAAIAATNLEIAEQAMAAIDVDYEPLPAVFEPEAAMAEDAPLIHPDWATYRTNVTIGRNRNVAGWSRMHYGDVDGAFARADHIYEHRFTTPLQHAGYTEPRASVAAWDGSGGMTIWTTAQLPFEVQTVVAEILDIPSSQVRVIIPGIGGGFGGKLRIGVEHFAALLVRECGLPVKVVCTSEEELIAAHPRQAAIVTLKTGVMKNGDIVAREGRVIVDCGANAGSGPGTAAVALQVLAGPYRTPNLRLRSFAVYTNKVPSGSFRAPSGPMANFAVESQMDMIAADLGLDPLELRLRNVVHDGDTGPAGEVLNAVSVEECLRRAADAIGWDDRKPQPGRGKGIACSWWITTGGSSGVYLKLNPDGTVALTSGAVELGTGALTGAAQILAEDLGIDLVDVKVATVDTQNVPYDHGAQGSRTAFAVGNACLAAAADLRRQIFALVAERHGLPADDMVLRDKCVIAGDKRIPLAEIARMAQLTGGGLIAHGTTYAPRPAHDPARVENHPLPAWNTPSFHAHAADVTVDAETGEVTINRYVVAQDVGYAINPTYIEGQIEGGVAQGLGLALSEEIVYRDGHVLNANLTDYKMPTSLDVPPIESILVECPSKEGPHGVKGVGEPPCIAPPATIANAIAAATGLWVTSLPITAEKIVRGLKARTRRES
jgi:CO/xanthine dehydrogenase Mo-binding subunit